MNVEFQRKSRRDKKGFLREQCKDTRLPCPGPLRTEASVSHGGAPASGARLLLRGHPPLQALLWVGLWWVWPWGPALLEQLWGQEAVCSVLFTSQLESWIGLLSFFYQQLLAICQNKVSHRVLSLICLALHVSLNSQSSWSPKWGGGVGVSGGAGAGAPAANPGLTFLCVFPVYLHEFSRCLYSIQYTTKTTFWTRWNLYSVNTCYMDPKILQGF